MADEGLVLEHLRALRADTRVLREGQEQTNVRLTQLEIGQANILGALSQNFTDFARQQVELDRVNARLDRIERRLELVDEPKVGV